MYVKIFKLTNQTRIPRDFFPPMNKREESNIMEICFKYMVTRVASFLTVLWKYL